MIDNDKNNTIITSSNKMSDNAINGFNKLVKHNILYKLKDYWTKPLYKQF